MILSPAWPQVLDFLGTPVVIEPSPGQLSSDAGLLPVRQFDQRIGLAAELLHRPGKPAGVVRHPWGKRSRQGSCPGGGSPRTARIGSGSSEDVY
jgi:hypothetical protein